MELAPESPSDGAHAIFARQQAIYRRLVEADFMSHRALFGILHDLLKARRLPFSFLDLASGDASCSVGALRRGKSNHLGACLELRLPENLRTFVRIVLDGGFRTFEHLYTDPLCFYGAFRAVA